MIDQIFHRQLDILAPQDIKKKVGLIGTGGIGSPTALVLAKMGIPELTFWDNDKVEIHNLPNQLFKTEDIGNAKVKALHSILNEFGTNLKKYSSVKKKWDKTVLPIMITAVDSMETRKAIWKVIKKNHLCDIHIETRMGAELMRIYAINPSDPTHIAFYEKTLYSSKESVKTPCTERAIFYNCFIIAGLVGCLIKKHIKQEDTPKEIIFDLKTFTFLKM